MRFARYFLISIIAIAVADKASACWTPRYSPGGYYMYRVYDDTSEIQQELEGYYPGSKKNCMDWQALTSKSIPIDDIYAVVYKMTLCEFETIYDNRSQTYENKFVEWITKKDNAVLDFILLAKTNEYIRLQRNSRWYYPSMKTGARMSLEEVAEKSLSVNDKRLRSRYLLQGIRALFSLSRYDECIRLWENEIVKLPQDDLMRQLIQPYIAGAEFRIKRSEKAIEYFARLGDVESMLFCSGRGGASLSTVDALRLVCEYAPDSKYVKRTLQSCIRELEPDGEYFCNPQIKDTNKVDELCSLCMDVVNSGKSKEPSMWYYTAAFLSDLKGDTTGASYLIGLAENGYRSKLISESIKVFRMYIDAKTLPYNSVYENKLFAQLKWLDSKIVNNIDDAVKKDTIEGDKLIDGVSYYYWNDMLRRILLTEVCPRMIREGKTTRALQLANMADNRLYNIVNRRKIYFFSEDDSEGIEKTVTMAEYRYSSNGFNGLDYSNHFFEMIDSLGVHAVNKYVKNVERPTSEFDGFLNKRGYVGNDYLYDILGTHYLRNMRYAEAYNCLGKVSSSYKNHLNVFEESNPFRWERARSDIKSNFRYEFAGEMYSLERSIEKTSNPDCKAKMMVRYAIGLRNSFSRCWQLTQYYKGSCFQSQVCKKRDWEGDEYTSAAKLKAEQMINYACKIASDEVAAEIQYTMCNYQTIMKRYPDTEIGKLVRGRCDNLSDHHAK